MFLLKTGFVSDPFWTQFFRFGMFSGKIPTLCWTWRSDFPCLPEAEAAEREIRLRKDRVQQRWSAKFVMMEGATGESLWTLKTPSKWQSKGTGSRSIPHPTATDESSARLQTASPLSGSMATGDSTQTKIFGCYQRYVRTLPGGMKRKRGPDFKQAVLILSDFVKSYWVNLIP